MRDHSDLIERLQDRAASYRLGGPSSEHTALLLDQAASALSSQSLSLSEEREEIERLKGLVAGIRECPQEPWQDIATAPKDGTFVITCVAGFVPGIAHWATYGDVTRWGADPETFMEEDHFLDYWVACRYDPTHWMPLPPRPSALENGPAGLADATTNPASSDLSSLRKGAEVVGEAAAYDFVADWHGRQAKLFREMAEDDPRTAEPQRKRAFEAAIHHAASAAALRNRAADDRRAALVSGSREGR